MYRVIPTKDRCTVRDKRVDMAIYERSRVTQNLPNKPNIAFSHQPVLGSHRPSVSVQSPLSAKEAALQQPIINSIKI